MNKRRAKYELTRRIDQILAKEKSGELEFLDTVCRKLGLTIEEIKPKSPAMFRGANVPPNVAEVRFKHFEARRRAKIHILVKALSEALLDG